ncbi:MAG TPA: hypothetical protein VHC49_02905 [Mycobacteriales bacterium]|nr:hypothetical protein [Mycobacteriales bacterium]
MPDSTRFTRRSFIGMSAAAGLSIPLLAACGSGSDSGSGAKAQKPSNDPVDVMGLTASDEVGTSRFDYAKKQSPKLKLKLDKNGFDQQKFATAIGGGSSPAGVYLDRQLIATYAEKGFLIPLDDYIDSLGIDMSQFYDQAVQEATYKGHVYGIPDFYTTRAIFGNNRALTGAGLSISDIDTSDWDKLAQQTKAMYKSSGGKPTTIGFDPKLPEYLPLWVLANGGSIIDSDGKPALDDSKVVEALTYTAGLIADQGGWANYKSFRDTWDFFGEGNEFTKNQIGAMPYEQWYINVLAPYQSKIDVSATQFKARDGKPLTFASGAAFAITKGSPNPGGMAQFMKDVTSKEAWAAAAKARNAVVQKDHSIYTGISSANKPANDAAEKLYMKPGKNKEFDEIIAVFNDSLDNAKTIQTSPAGQDIAAAFQQAVTDTLGGKDPKSALSSAQSRAMSAYTDATG